MQCLCVPIVISTRETKQQTQNANSPSHLLPFEVSIKIQDTFWTGMTDHPWGHLVVSIIFNLSTVNRLPPPFNLSLSLAWQWGLLHGKFRAWSKFLWLNYQPLERGAYNGGADPALTPAVRGCNAVKDEAAQQSAFLIRHLAGEGGLVYFFVSASKTCGRYFEMYFIIKSQWWCSPGLECPFWKRWGREIGKRRKLGAQETQTIECVFHCAVLTWHFFFCSCSSF